MRDDKQYDNDGVEVKADETTAPCRYKTFGSFPWIRLALILILIGVILSGFGRLSGARTNNVNIGFHNNLRNHGRLHQRQHRNTAAQSVVMVSVEEAIALTQEIMETFEITMEAAIIDDITAIYGGDTFTFTEAELGSMPVNAFSHAVINAFSGNVNISGCSSNEFRIEHHPRGLINFDLVNGHLIINMLSGGGTLRIYVPSDAEIQDLIINSVSGNINIEDVRWNDLFAGTISGNINVEGYHNNSTTLYSTSGNITAEIVPQNGEPAYHISSVSGRVTVNGSRAPNRTYSNTTDSADINIETISGRINVYIEK